MQAVLTNNTKINCSYPYCHNLNVQTVDQQKLAGFTS